MMETLPKLPKPGDVVRFHGYMNTKSMDTVPAICEVTVTRIRGESVFYGIKKGVNCMGKPFQHDLSFHISRLIEIVSQ